MPLTGSISAPSFNYMLFKAFEVAESSEKEYKSALVTKSEDDLPPGEVLIKVQYSSLNYKDALSAIGNKGVTRNYPHTPGIDAAGTVEKSADPHFNRGDKVIVTGYDLGMNTSGGFAEYIRVPASWPVHLPEGLSRKRSMMFGTAGLTAALSVYNLKKQGITPPNGKIIVTGASGGVGSLAVAILSHLGFHVTAVTGKEDAVELLLDLGAKEVIPRAAIDDHSGKPFLKAQYAAAIDTVGGNILATVLKSLNYGGVATCCGLVSSPELHTTIYPFILKGIRLIGIDSVLCDHHLRREIWEHLATDWRPAKMDKIVSVCTLDTIQEHLDSMLKGQLTGRYIVKISS